MRPSALSNGAFWETPEARAAEKAILERSHLHFTAKMFREREGQPFIVGPHHRVMCAALDRVLRGECRRLLINVPPGFTKTEAAVISFMAHGFAIEPRARFIHASYAAPLALDNSAKVKETIALEAYQKHWPVSLKDDTTAKGLWKTDEGGGVRAAASGEPITGFRAGQMFDGFSGALIIDDPLKPDDAGSDAERSAVNRRYMGTFRSRLAHEDVPIVIIMQRLDVEDLSGFLLTGGGGEPFEHLWLPAEIDGGRAYPPEWSYGRPIEHGLPDGPLWERKLDAAQLQVLKVNPTTYAAQYAQEPTSASGDYFKGEWFRTVDRLPPLETMRVYGGSDYAVTADGGDYTVHAVVGVDPDNRMYVLDIWRKQAASDEWVESFCDLVKRWRPVGWAEEQGQIKAGVGPWLVRRMREAGAHVAREQFPTRGDKATRAQSIRGRMALDGIYIAKDAPWRADLVSECLRFPAGVHDDIVDSLGLIGQLLDRMTRGAHPSAETPKIDSGYGRRSSFGGSSFRTV